MIDSAFSITAGCQTGGVAIAVRDARITASGVVPRLAVAAGK